ncbi:MULTISPECIES: hypothetical protein [unclassified Bradyrhizobium]|uniref:hypothetical protein n=1 Tax=unclassified Bradyrhizobium TaxID=2631580 RepID=UPI00291630A0|nr:MULTISPECIES: hypothetical protein [unclassified Bradyrhizobium]
MKWLLRAILASNLVSLCSNQASAFDWDYKDARFDLSASAILGDRAAFESWRNEPLNYIKEQFEGAVNVAPELVGVHDPIKKAGFAIEQIDLLFPHVAQDGADLRYTVAVARPDNPNPDLPTIVAINGHGEVGGEGSGQAPTTLFDDNGHGAYLARGGFTVVAFPNTIHAPFADLSRRVDYSIIWARLADLALTRIKPLLNSNPDYIGLGNAAGGLTSLVLAIVRPDIKAMAANGAFFSLEHTRREYRIFTHPFCHDFRAFFSYSALYALLAPKPLLIEEGRRDGLWLGYGASHPESWFSGTKRGAISDETIGAYLELKQIWMKFGSLIELDIHDKGHEDVDTSEFVGFVQRVRAASP